MRVALSQLEQTTPSTGTCCNFATSCATRRTICRSENSRVGGALYGRKYWASVSNPMLHSGINVAQWWARSWCGWVHAAVTPNTMLEKVRFHNMTSDHSWIQQFKWIGWSTGKRGLERDRTLIPAFREWNTTGFLIIMAITSSSYRKSLWTVSSLFEIFPEKSNSASPSAITLGCCYKVDYPCFYLSVKLLRHLRMAAYYSLNPLLYQNVLGAICGEQLGGVTKHCIAATKVRWNCPTPSD